MEYHWIVPLAAATSNVSLALLVNLKGKQTLINQVFTFLAVSLVFWNLIYVVLYSIRDPDLALTLASSFRAGGLFLFPAIFHLCVALPARPRSRLLDSAVVLNYALAVGFVIANALGLLVTKLHKVGWGYYSTGTELYDAFSVYVVLNFIGAFALLIYELKISDAPRTRLQLKFWMLALVVSLPMGLTNLLPVYGFEVYPVGNLGSAAWAAVVAYAIVRHRLMDIELAVTKSLAYVIVLVGIIGPALSVTAWLQHWAFGRIHPDFTAAMFVLLSAVGVLFPLGKGAAERKLQRSLFSQKQEARDLLSKFSQSILTILDKQKLLSELCHAITKNMNAESASIFVGDDLRRRFVCAYSCGPRPVDDSFGLADAFVSWLGDARESVLVEESLGAEARGLEVSEVFQRNAWFVCIPLCAGGLIIGFIALGKKRSLDAYSVADLDILNDLSAQASVALENARLYDQLRKSEEIINRTDRLSALGTLAAGIAHEIRNPLVSIQTFFQLAPDRLNDAEFRNSFMALAAGEVSRIRDLVGELLSYARSTTPSIKRVRVEELVERVTTLMIPHARKRSIDLKSEILDAAIAVEADGDQLTQVLVNVVLNAVQAAPEHGRVKIEVGADTIGGRRLCRIRVEDNGPGVPEDLRDVIFNPFFTTKELGTGLGLAIAHRIVADTGGFIRVGVQPSGGGFEIFLPSADEVERLVS